MEKNFTGTYMEKVNFCIFLWWVYDLIYSHTLQQECFCNILKCFKYLFYTSLARGNNTICLTITPIVTSSLKIIQHHLTGKHIFSHYHTVHPLPWGVFITGKSSENTSPYIT